MRLAWLCAVQLLMLGGCGHAVSYPDEIRSESDAQLAERFRPQQILSYDRGSIEYKALVFRERKSDYKVVFYRRDHGVFRRLGTPQDLLVFDEPQLVRGNEPRIEAWHPASKEMFHFEERDDRVELMPDSGAWHVIKAAGSR